MEKLLSDLGIKYNDINIYKQALTHPSAKVNTQIKLDNQRLEFLGDAVLSVLMSDYLYRVNEGSEGDLSKIRAGYVCESALAYFAQKLGICDHLLIGPGEDKSKPSIQADAFEAFIAAVFIDLGINPVKEFFNLNIIPMLNDEIVQPHDYKSKLQELVQADKRTVVYKVVKQSGPPHEPTFTVEVYVDELLFGVGEGSNKKKAQQNAAKSALDKVAK